MKNLFINVRSYAWRGKTFIKLATDQSSKSEGLTWLKAQQHDLYVLFQAIYHDSLCSSRNIRINSRTVSIVVAEESVK